ncbi:MAG TPA: zinc ribbon domain-containing protein [Dehalococcoidia bacterium]|nr:zinc ribbon domain-containing protein [Dehalococcoidia bacterium]
MPIYEYKCKKCDGKFEMLRGMFDSDDNIRCPECGEEHPERVFSVFGSKSSGSDCLPTSSGST